ncbi:MAG: folate-binding protein YgfZ [Legionellaceae bacterium]|nr:folate-binding protein YgfZ [Legionellaceae bacterium]MBP9775843.1 folate-binding protein YgfZ [Legionellaceae bacterium]
MKPMITHTLNERVYTVFHSLAQDLCFAPEQSYVFDLDHLCALEVAGTNPATFLQGQLTCDVDAVNANQMRPGGMCSLQGRLLALLDVVAWHGLHLVMPKDLIVSTQQALAKTAMFSRVTLKTNHLLTCVGLYIPQAAMPGFLPIPLPTEAWQATHNADMFCYALSQELFIFLLRDPSQKEALMAQFSAEQHRGSLAWHYLELQQTRMTIYPNTRGLFLPHRLNLHNTPYISFKKGCYKGQEIIARTHYRAKLKHSLKLFQVTTSDPIFAGQKCYTTLQKPEIGEIIDYCPTDSGQYLLALSILSDHPAEVYFESHTTSVLLQSL